MKLKDNYTLMELGGEYVAVPVGDAAETLRGVIRLNETGREVWLGLADALTAEEIAARLTEQYEVSADDALRDVKNQIDTLRKYGVLTD